MKLNWRRTAWKALKSALVAGAGAAAVALAGDDSLVEVAQRLPPWAAMAIVAGLSALRNTLKAR